MSFHWLQVQSILQPAQDAAAAECFRLILTGNGSSINSLLRQMKQPLLLLWGVRLAAPRCPTCFLLCEMTADSGEMITAIQCTLHCPDVVPADCRCCVLALWLTDGAEPCRTETRGSAPGLRTESCSFTPRPPASVLMQVPNQTCIFQRVERVSPWVA